MPETPKVYVLCGKCRHWVRSPNGTNGICRKLSDGEEQAAGFEFMTYYAVKMLTPPTFGCVLGEPRPPQIEPLLTLAPAPLPAARELPLNTVESEEG